jgi:hypothetical protein
VPGPALFFVVVDGVPSEAAWIMVGSGNIEDQPISADAELPISTISAQFVAQYGGTMKKRDDPADESWQSGGWSWGRGWSLLWSWSGQENRTRRIVWTV